MPDSSDGRVAVYIDFDNIVISRYDQVHGRGHFKRDGARDIHLNSGAKGSEGAARVEQARVNIGAVLDYATSFGTVAISRAYADWSVPVNMNYRSQLVSRAVDLVQMFPTVQSMKNGADIRMSVDVVEDLFRLPEITHVVVVSGDSDFIALAQRCRRLGRYVVGIGVAGGTSKALSAACNEYKDYDGLLAFGGDSDDDADAGGSVDAVERDTVGSTGKKQARTRATAATTTKDATKAPKSEADTSAKTDAAAKTVPTTTSPDSAKPSEQRAATALLRRALELGEAKDEEWIPSSAVKNQMLRMDNSFQESVLGYKNFTEFAKSRGSFVELREDGQLRHLRLRGAGETGK